MCGTRIYGNYTNTVHAYLVNPKVQPYHILFSVTWSCTSCSTFESAVDVKLSFRYHTSTSAHKKSLLIFHHAQLVLTPTTWLLAQANIKSNSTNFKSKETFYSLHLLHFIYLIFMLSFSDLPAALWSLSDLWNDTTTVLILYNCFIMFYHSEIYVEMSSWYTKDLICFYSLTDLSAP